MRRSATRKRHGRRRASAGNRRRLLLVPAVLLCLVLGLPTGALAYWSAGGAGVANATSGNVLPPTSVTAAQLPGVGTIRIGWERSTSPNVTGYRVERSTGGGAWGASCGGTTLSSDARTCDDPGLAHESSHRYRVVAVKGGWTATSAGTPVVVIDTSQPTVTVRVAQGQPNPTNSSTPANPIRFIVEFSEAVSGFTTGDITLGGTAGSGASATVTASSSTVYAVTVSGATTTAPGGGTVVVSVPAGVAQDGAGNLNTASGGASVLYDPNAPATPIAPDLAAATDTTAPSLATTTGRTDNITNSSSLAFTSTEAVPATPLPTDTVGGSVLLYRSASATGINDPAQPIATAGITAGGYTLGDPGAAGLADGTYHYSVRYLDLAGNLSAESPRLAVTVDRTAPVPSMTYTRAILTLIPLLGSVTVAGTAPHTPGDLLPLEVRICNGSSATCATPNAAAVTADSSTGAYTYTTSSLLGGILASSTAQVSQYDRAGNQGFSTPITLPGLVP